MESGNSITPVRAVPLTRNASFLKLWVGQSISEVGSRITREGLPLTAVLVLHASPGEMGLLSGLGAASVLLFGLAAGVWGDRLRRRPILIAADIGRALVLCSVPLAAMRHVLGMPQLYLVAALAGILTVFFDVAYQSYLPALVYREQLVEGNTKLMISANTAEILGPGLTGVLVQLITAPMAILFDAMSFLFSALMVGLIRAPEPAPQPRSEHEHIWAETLAGLRFIRHDAILRALALRSITAFFFFGFMGTLYVLYAVRTLGLQPAALGFIIAVGGGSGLAGSLLSARVVQTLGLGPTFIVTALMHGLAACFIPAAHAPVPYAVSMMVGAQFFGDCAFAVYFINETSLRQMLVPAHVLGRVNGAMQLASRGMVPLGAVAGGFLAGSIGIRAVLWIAAAGVLASSGWLIASPVRTLHAIPPERAAARVL